MYPLIVWQMRERYSYNARSRRFWTHSSMPEPSTVTIYTAKSSSSPPHQSMHLSRSRSGVPLLDLLLRDGLLQLLTQVERLMAVHQLVCHVMPQVLPLAAAVAHCHQLAQAQRLAVAHSSLEHGKCHRAHTPHHCERRGPNSLQLPTDSRSPGPIHLRKGQGRFHLGISFISK